MLLGRKKSNSQIKTITTNEKELTEPVHIANHFNQYLSTVADNLVRKIQKINIDPLNYLGPNMKNSLYLYPTSPKEIQNIVSNLQSQNNIKLRKK